MLRIVVHVQEAVADIRHQQSDRQHEQQRPRHALDLPLQLIESALGDVKVLYPVPILVDHELVSDDAGHDAVRYEVEEEDLAEAVDDARGQLEGVCVLVDGEVRVLVFAHVQVSLAEVAAQACLQSSADGVGEGKVVGRQGPLGEEPLGVLEIGDDEDDPEGGGNAEALGEG